MGQIRLIIHGKLNHFVAPKWKNRFIDFEFNGVVSLKHILESLGIPHPEIGEVRIGSRTASLDDHVQDRDVIDVYPYNSSFNHLNPNQVLFILDNNLGKLNDYLRLLGFDTLYNPDWEDQKLAELASSQERILLTRDHGLLKRKIVRLGYCVRSDLPRQQVEEVIEQFGLAAHVKPFQRCVRCNGLLQPVDKQEIIDQLLPLTRLYYNEFMRCTDCGQIYWKGSHYEHMQEFIRKFSNENDDSGQSISSGG